MLRFGIVLPFAALVGPTAAYDDLHSAAYEGGTAALYALLAADADPNARNSSGRTPADYLSPP